MNQVEIGTQKREEIIDITSKIREIAETFPHSNGAVMIFCPHTTCGLTINESADPDVKLDLIAFFREIAPINHNWRHREGNTDAHIRASLLGSSLLVPFWDNRIQLGTWQAIYLYEGDGPRRRKLWIQFLPAI